MRFLLLRMMLREEYRMHTSYTSRHMFLAFPALVGLGMIVGGLGLGWHGIVERDAVPVQHFADDLTQAALLIAISGINVWNRLNVATRQVVGGWKP